MKGRRVPDNVTYPFGYMDKAAGEWEQQPGPAACCHKCGRGSGTLIPEDAEVLTLWRDGRLTCRACSEKISKWFQTAEHWPQGWIREETHDD